MYSHWPTKIGQAEVCLVQPPGRENRISELHYGTYEELARQFVDAALPEFDRPFGFFGHCGGALPGFVVAVELVKRGLPGPAAIFISSQVPPHLGPSGRFLEMNNAELAVELANVIRELGGQPSPDLITMGLRVLRSDIEASRKYSLQSPVRMNMAIKVIGWNDDRLVPYEQMAEWCEYCNPEKYSEVLLEGGHYSFLKAPLRLLRELDQGMDLAVEML